MEFLNRLAQEKFLRMSKSFPVVLVTGARQIGKTTMLEHLAKGENRTYVTLDDLNARSMAINDPELFFQNYRTPIIIDEVQYAPNLFSQIKLICDKSKTPGEFWLTGSQSYGLMQGVSESLAGRIGIIEMSSFTFDEYRKETVCPPFPLDFEQLKANENANHSKSVDEIFRFIFNGSLPRTFYLDSELKRDYYNSYVNTYLLRDARDLGNATDLVKFHRFLTACASSIASQLNLATLASAADITQPTAKNWLYVLKGLGIIYLLEPYHQSEIKRLTKSPKLYFYDTGLAANLSLWPSYETLKVSPMSGAYFENYVLNQIIKKLSFSQVKPNFFYYRDTAQNEIDLIIETHEGLTPIEVKMTSRPHYSDTNKFTLLQKFNKPVLTGGLICAIEKAVLLKNGNIALPVSSI